MTVLGAYTAFHVLLSLVGIAAGFVVIAGMLRGRLPAGWNKLFLITTIATSVTGFGFPVDKLLPSHAIGILSLVILAAALVALYSKHLAGSWRATFVITAVAAQYLNFFVLIVQSFFKVPALHELAPTQSEPPFAIAQGVALVVFLVLGVLAVKRFKAPVS